jgi:hypothetical protein
LVSIIILTQREQALIQRLLSRHRARHVTTTTVTGHGLARPSGRMVDASLIGSLARHVECSRVDEWHERDL